MKNVEETKYKPTEKELQKWGEKVTKALYGFTKDDLEPLFERFVLPIYGMCARSPVEESKWKIINRITEEEYNYENARKGFIDLKLVNWK